MTPTTLLGLVAGALTTFAGLPQLVRIVRTGRSADLSAAALASFTVGITLWLVYGIAIGELPVVLWNAVSLAIYLALGAVKLTHLRAEATATPQPSAPSAPQRSAPT